jgi:hypothetical protein
MPRIVAIMRRLLDQALKGNQRAIELCLKLAKEIGAFQANIDELQPEGIVALSDEELAELERMFEKMRRGTQF